VSHKKNKKAKNAETNSRTARYTWARPTN